MIKDFPATKSAFQIENWEEIIEKAQNSTPEQVLFPSLCGGLNRMAASFIPQRTVPPPSDFIHSPSTLDGFSTDLEKDPLIGGKM